ncbi:MAG: hypothetical protein M1836_003651 [Candelina mexicana]|nr:MAG: hypothetical protein M1836_003651 [Candelina mexicana]
MSRQAADVYFRDTSGPRKRPNLGSKTQSSRRIYYQTHETLLEGLLHQGLAPMTDRLKLEMKVSIFSLGILEYWTEFPDLMEFYRLFLGTTVIKTIFGSALLSLHPNFVQDLWDFDGVVMSLAKRLPIFCVPRTYRLRRKLLQCIKRWHTYARTHSAGHESVGNQDDDPYWGCKMIRDRYMALCGTEGQDHDSVASTDLAFIWSTVTNVVPSAMALLIHTLGDPSVFLEVQQAVARATESRSQLRFDMKKLEQEPLLLSLYAETLRYGVQIYIPRHSPHQAVTIGDRTIPSDKVLIFNTWLAHTDKAVWNTKSGTYPVEKFWARRFIIDPKDPSSGPCQDQYKIKSDPAFDADNSSQIRYSTEGLQGAWIPYGGGHHACPGRLLAKRIMLLSCAAMITMFDIELMTGSNKPEFGPSRFGLGVQVPTTKVPFRIRKRQHTATCPLGAE